MWESGTGGLEAIVTGDEQHQEGAWFGPEALLPYRVIDENDKRAAVEYDVEADSRIHPGSTSPACQVRGEGRGDGGEDHRREEERHTHTCHSTSLHMTRNSGM